MGFEKKINTSILLKAASQFEKFVRTAQYSQTTSADPMRTELERSIGAKVKNVAAKFLHEKGVSSIQININYQGPNAASFVVYADGADKDIVQNEMPAALSQLAPVAAKIISKYQKEPMDYKYTQYDA